MYHPPERYAKARQEQLIEEANPQPRKERTTFFSRLFSGLFRAREKAPKAQQKATEARRLIRPTHTRSSARLPNDATQKFFYKEAQMSVQPKHDLPSQAKRKTVSVMISFVLTLGLLFGASTSIFRPGGMNALGKDDPFIEPEAGSWQTWVLESGSQLRLPPHPSKKETKAEINEVLGLAQNRDDIVLAQIAYWSTGSPMYRWNEITVNETLKNNIGGHGGARIMALLHVAMFDATVAAWDSKAVYNRPRPSEFDKSIEPVIPNPKSPSYPSEHAVAAGAASEMLAYLFPGRADFFREKAEEAGQAFLMAGVQYPSDIEAGLELGRQVALQVIEWAKEDGSDAVWDGIIPTGPGLWTGENPAAPMAGTWKTWVLSSAGEFRPAPPLAYDSPELAAEMDELRNYPRTPKTNADAFYNEYGIGGLRNWSVWSELSSKKIFEYRLEENPPRAARVYALVATAYYDALVACWDGKYAYWAIRPFQLDPSLQTLFNTPNHPSYPAAHSCGNTAGAEVLASLFQNDALALRTMAQDAGESRIAAGIHFRSDVVAGETLGRDVAQKAIERAEGGIKIYNDVERFKTNVTFNSKLDFNLPLHKALHRLGFYTDLP
jgi:membrane-associated phospholipid phosphatase